MVLRDFYCNNCGETVEDVMVESYRICDINAYCEVCKEETEHFCVCNGGLNSRYRFADWPTDSSFYRGQCKVSAPKATWYDDYGKEHDLMKANSGEAMHDSERFSEDKRSENLDKAYFKDDCKKGRNKIWSTKKAT